MARRDDTEFLRERVEKRERTTTATKQVPRAKLLDNANTYIEEATSDRPDASIMQAKLHKRAQARLAASETSTERQEERDAQQAALDEQRQELEQSGRMQDRIRVAARTAGETVGPLQDKVGSLPTPGGNGFLLMVLLILLLTIVVVNRHGDTRLKQLWYMLNGRATIAGRQDVKAYDPTPQTSATGPTNNPNSPLPPNTQIIPLTNNGVVNNPLDILPQLDTGF